MIELDRIYTKDAIEGLEMLPDESITTCVTSPPYWRLRDYGMPGQYGIEESPEAYVEKLVTVFEQVRRVLKPEGTLWLNIGDCYWGSGKAGKSQAYQQRHTEFGKPSRHKSRFGLPTTGKHPGVKAKDLIGLPWLLAFALREKGWFLRQDIIWHKPNATPESVLDRCTRSHEYIFLLSKSARYYFDSKAIREIAAYDGRKQVMSAGSPKYKLAGEGSLSAAHKRWQFDQEGTFLRNKRSVWAINLKPFKGAHFAGFPEVIPSICIRAGTKENDVVLDPFMGSGTTALAAKSLNRHFIGIELNPDYTRIAETRLREKFGIFCPDSL